MIFQTEDWTLGNSHARCSDQPIIFQKKNMETSQQNSQKPQTTSTSLQQFPTRKPPIKTPWFVFDASWTQESQHLENASHDMLQVTASSPLEVRCLTLVEWSSLNPSSLFNHLANWNNVSPTFGFPWNSPGFPFPFQKATFLGWGTSIFNSTAGFFFMKIFSSRKLPLWWFASLFESTQSAMAKKMGLQAENAQGGNDLIWTKPWNFETHQVADSWSTQRSDNPSQESSERKEILNFRFNTTLQLLFFWAVLEFYVLFLELLAACSFSQQFLGLFGEKEKVLFQNELIGWTSNLGDMCCKTSNLNAKGHGQHTENDLHNWGRINHGKTHET